MAADDPARPAEVPHPPTPDPSSQPESASDSVDAPESALVDVGIIDERFISYRAVHPLAVVSLLLGPLSICCFLDLRFLALALLGLIFGVIALRAIRAKSDQYVGASYARIGIAISLFFALSSVSYTYVSRQMLQSSLVAFTQQTYLKALSQGSLAEGAYFRFYPTQREEFAPQELLDQTQLDSPELATEIIEEVEILQRRIKGRNGADPDSLEFVEVLSLDFLRQDRPEGFVLLKFAGGLDHPDARGELANRPRIQPVSGRVVNDPRAWAFVLVKIGGAKRPDAPGYQWWVSETYYPYVPEEIDQWYPQDGSGEPEAG